MVGTPIHMTTGTWYMYPVVQFIHDSNFTTCLRINNLEVLLFSYLYKYNRHAEDKLNILLHVHRSCPLFTPRFTPRWLLAQSSSSSSSSRAPFHFFFFFPPFFFLPFFFPPFFFFPPQPPFSLVAAAAWNFSSISWRLFKPVHSLNTLSQHL